MNLTWHEAESHVNQIIIRHAVGTHITHKSLCKCKTETGVGTEVVRFQLEKQAPMNQPNANFQLNSYVYVTNLIISRMNDPPTFCHVRSYSCRHLAHLRL